MTTISVPLDKDTMRYLEHLAVSNPEMSKSGIVRKAIRIMTEEEALRHVLEAQREPTIRTDAVTYLKTMMRKR